ncbi:hypothetical protein DFJ74DRAFT_38817 [Hyaloraphidium curvatum]|nr:hypothetical protein DFJ74DRAFT_38817 [Hyaloraphidium curvatum]
MNASEFLYQPSPALPPTSAAGYGAPAAAGGGGGGGGQGGSLQVPGAYPAYAAPAASQGQMGSQQPAAPGMNGINGQVYGAAGAYPTPVSSPASPPAYPQVPPTRQPYANQYLDSGIPLGPVGAAADDDLDDDSDVSSVESLQAPEGGQNLFSATISKMESTFSQTMKARVGKNTKGRALAILASFCLDFAALVFIVSATSGIATWNLTLTWTAYTAATYNGVPGVDVYTGIWGQVG